MAIFTFDEAIKNAGIKSNQVKSLGMLPLSPERQSILEQKKQQALTTEAEAQRIASPMGQAKEFVKSLGETLGITPIGRKTAGIVAPFVVPQTELPEVVEELAGGVSEPRKMGDIGKFAKQFGAGENLAEGIDIAADLPLISLGLSKSIAGTIGKQLPKYVGGPALNLLEKELSEFMPNILKKILETDISTPVKETIGDITGKVGDIAQKTKVTLFGRAKQANTIDDVIKQADETLKAEQITAKPSEIRAVAEAETAKPSIFQKWAGISSDIKNRISGKQEKLKEYFDVAHARNNFDTLPTPLEYGTKNVDKAVTSMEGTLNDTGSRIGKFRKKVATYEANIDQVNKVNNSFTNELNKLNLEIYRGAIRQIPGKVTRVGSEGEIKVLNDLYDDLLTVKENPNLEKLIDLRNQFDNKINFAKSAREVSSSLDSLSRTIRKQIADVAAGVVGKSEAGNLARYSDFMDALTQLKSFTDRKAGAEFLLKQVLSERGRTPREVMQTIKEFTGIDLMDDATMASIATDLIGNSRQKGLFRQEIIKAGLDAQAALRGDTSGAINLMFNFLKKRVVNEEKQFLKAAK